VGQIPLGLPDDLGDEEPGQYRQHRQVWTIRPKLSGRKKKEEIGQKKEPVLQECQGEEISAEDEEYGLLKPGVEGRLARVSPLEALAQEDLFGLIQGEGAGDDEAKE
jgi:hypothetical protein